MNIMWNRITPRKALPIPAFSTDAPPTSRAAAAMMVIGRGHTVYFDNKTLEDYQGQTYKAFEKVVVTVKDEQVAKPVEIRRRPGRLPGPARLPGPSRSRRPRRDGEWVWAEKTSLGGDNGIAVAMILAILADGSLPHPPLEAVFTVDEEVGLEGAFALDCSDLKGRKLVNLDSEEEGHQTPG